jgi:hypothetical protein
MTVGCPCDYGPDGSRSVGRTGRGYISANVANLDTDHSRAYLVQTVFRSFFELGGYSTCFRPGITFCVQIDCDNAKMVALSSTTLDSRRRGSLNNNAMT